MCYCVGTGLTEQMFDDIASFSYPHISEFPSSVARALVGVSVRHAARNYFRHEYFVC